MRIAFDAEFLRLPPSGIGEYVANLIPAILAADPAVDVAVLEPGWDHRLSGSRTGFRDRRIQRAAWELYGTGRAARRAGVDLLHVPSFAAPLFAPKPLVVTIHDVIPLLMPAYRVSRAMRAHVALMCRTVRNADLVIAPSRAAARDIAQELEIDPQRIRVTYEAAGAGCVPATDTASAHAAVRRFGITGRYIFNVGGLDVRKNVPVLLRAFARVRTRIPGPLQLVISGAPHSDNPSVFPPLEPVIRRLGLEQSVVLTGRVSEADKLALYRAADLYVTPSYYEGFGLTALEAMACGVPVITSNRSSFPEVVDEGGLLVAIEDDALAAAMELVLSNRTVAEDLRQRGLERSASFSWRRTAELTLDVYREAIGMRCGGPSRGG